MAQISDFDASLCEKFMKAENDLLQVDSVFEDSSATTEYIDHFSALAQSTAYGIANRLLSSRTLALVRRVAFNVTSMANNLRGLEPRTKAVEAKREAELDSLFARLSLKDNTPGTQTSNPLRPGTTRENKASSITEGTRTATHALVRSASEETLVEVDEARNKVIGTPTHVSLCYSWLRKNPFNPYPSHGVKERIASKCDISIKTVDSWFCNIRRRIGWIRLSKAHFGGVRALTVDYAQRVLQEGNQDGSVPHNIAIDFLRMRAELDKAYDMELGTSETIKAVEERLSSDNKSTRKLPPRPDETSGESVNPSIDCIEPPGQSNLLVKALPLEKSLLLHKSPPSEVQTLPAATAEDQGASRHSSKRRRSVSTDSHNSKRVRTSASDSPAGFALSPQVTSPPAAPLRSQKRRLSQSEPDTAPPAKRSCGSLQHPVPASELTDLDQSWSEYVFEAPETATVGRPISDGDLAMGTYNWFSNSMAVGTSAVVAESSILDDFSRDFVEVSQPAGASTGNPPKRRTGETSHDLDDMINSSAAGGRELTAEAEEDPLAMLRPEDFGGDFADFPVMPDFDIDWTNISPPSLESFLMSSDHSLSAPMSITFPTTDRADFYCSPGSASTLVDPLAFPSSLLDKPSLQLDIIHSESSAVLDSMRDAASASAFVQKMPQTDKLA